MLCFSSDRSRRRHIVSLAAALALTSACGGTELAVAPDTSGSPNPATASSPATGEPAEVIEFEIDSASHVDGPVDYPQSPPVGGDHKAGWQNCGFYTIEVPNEQAVHSLEHGAVWVTYTDAAPADELDQLRDRAAAETHLLVTRYADQDTPFVLTAWERQLPLASITDAAFEDFLATFMGDGPTTPEPGAVCNQAFGIPPDDPSTIAN